MFATTIPVLGFAACTIFPPPRAIATCPLYTIRSPRCNVPRDTARPAPACPPDWCGRRIPTRAYAAIVSPEQSYAPGPAAPHLYGLPTCARANPTTWSTRLPFAAGTAVTDGAFLTAGFTAGLTTAGAFMTAGLTTRFGSGFVTAAVAAPATLPDRSARGRSRRCCPAGGGAGENTTG